MVHPKGPGAAARRSPADRRCGLKPTHGRADAPEVTTHHTDAFDPGSLSSSVGVAPPEDGSTPRGRPKSNAFSRRHQRRSPFQRTNRWGVVALLAAVLLQEGVAVYYERQLTAAARSITGRPDVEVRCGRVWDLLSDPRAHANPGFVYWGSTTANMQLPQCINAAGWADDPTDEGNRIGMMILTHELAHVMGHRNEAETECVSMWAAPTTALALGGSAEQGHATAQWYAAAHNPRMPADYRAPGCLSGAAPASDLLR